ncbi:DUF5681 domain-containing protein [Sphingomonas endolithica]|uniref:DUF5681 domain-containing protein n=1 Tax=Sphingomonas endolithica TaxID=2972485 RepID=UPI0021AF0F91|nr:DUF5681 domain-containing protein [Sphingomonas sp. ZFBP2030]
MPFIPIRPASPSAPVSPPARKRIVQVADPGSSPSIDSTSGKKRPHHKVDPASSNLDENGDYIIGKNRPPKATQWTKGQSGNPRGPVKRETLSAQARLEQTVLAPFTATVNGEAVSLTLDMFAVQSLKSAAAKGSVRAAQILLDFYVTIIRKVADHEPGPEIESWEREAIDQLLAELDLPKRPVIRQTNRTDMN